MQRTTMTLALAITASISFTPDVDAGQNAVRLEMRSGRPLSGVTAASSMGPQRVEIAGYRLRSVPAVTMARPVGYEVGLLPIVGFNAIYVSNSGKYVVVDPR